MYSDNVTSAENQQERHLSEVRLSESSETTCQIPFMSSHLATLLGLLYTDGCVSPRGNSYRLYFGVKSRALCLTFVRSVCHLFKVSRSKVRLTRRDGLHVAVIDSQSIGELLIHRFGTFRTLNYMGCETNARLPVDTLISTGYVVDFLRAAFSCDGGVCFYPATTLRNGKSISWFNRNIFLACSHEKLRSDYMDLLDSLSINAVNSYTDKKIKISNKKEILKFASQVGFLEGVEVTDHSRAWSGCDKSQVLSDIVASYKR